MRIKSSLIIDDNGKLGEFIKWINSRHQIKLHELPGGKFVEFQGYEDAEDYQEILAWLTVSGFCYKIVNRKVVYTKKEYSSAQVLLCVVNAEIYTKTPYSQESCSECGVYPLIREFDIDKDLIPNTDLVSLANSDIFFVSKEFSSKLEHSGLSGFRLIQHQDIPDYRILSIYSKIGEVLNKTPYIKAINCNTCKRKVITFSFNSSNIDIHHVYFKKYTYDGSDFSLPNVEFSCFPHFFVISQRVYQFLKSNKTTGYYAIPAFLE